jgi:hypothetical protein
MFLNGKKYEFGCGEFDGYGVSEKSVKTVGIHQKWKGGAHF